MKSLKTILICMMACMMAFTLVACSTQKETEEKLIAQASADAQASEKAAVNTVLKEIRGESEEPSEEPVEEPFTAEGGKPVVEITIEAGNAIEDGGVIDIELDPDQAPLTVENFLKLVNEGFYDGLTFHRIIPGFMIQGGDPEGMGFGGSDEEIKGEFANNGVDNDISHVRGVISMARGEDPDSASSQFFITNADSVFLDGDYAAFGRVINGIAVVDEISAVKRDSSDYPLEPVVIESIVQIS